MTIGRRILGVPERMQTRLEEKYDLAEKGIPPEKEKLPIEDDEEREDELAIWFLENVPEEFLDSRRGAFRIFKNILLEKEFLDIWNYRVVIQDGLTNRDLVIILLQIIKDLEKLSVFKLNSQKFRFLTKIPDAIREIEEIMASQKRENLRGFPSEEILNTARHVFSVKASLYLKRRAMIKKLEDILSILQSYRPVD